MAKKKAPQTPTLDRDWLTVQQTAEYLQCTTRSVHRYIEAGKLEFSQIVPNGKIRIPAASIRQMLGRSESE